MTCHLILYVKDQAASARFYSSVLDMKPTLDVPGMTEFRLGSNIVLGLMPEAGIKRLLGDAIKDPALAAGVPRAELYLVVEKPESCIDRALSFGAKSLSTFQARNWGDHAGYVADLDGHVIAFAKPS